MKWLLLIIVLASPANALEAPPENPMPTKKMYRPYRYPDHPIVKFLKHDIWSIYRMSKQCLETPNASICASAKSVYPEQSVFIVFRWKF